MTDTEPAGRDPILWVRDVSVRFGGIQAVTSATLDVQRGSITALIGPNGAGKTTLFNAMTGFCRSERGEVVFDGSPIFRHPAHEIARSGMVRTFQITKALAAMPVLDNLTFAAPRQPGEILPNLVLRRFRVAAREREVRDRARELLNVFGLGDKAAEYAGTLSGGQRKLLELARALMVEPRLVLLDEPMAGINPTLARRLLDHMHELRRERGMTFLVVEHDMEMVMNETDRVIVMAEGTVVAAGTPAEIQSDPIVIDVYLGRRHESAGASS